MHCQVINHTPAGYALRQTDAHPSALRIGELMALRVEGRAGPQVAIVRWFRNTMRGSGLEFGCEVLSDNPEAAAAALEGAPDGKRVPVVVLPPDAEQGRAPTTCCRSSSSPRAPSASTRAWRSRAPAKPDSPC